MSWSNEDIDKLFKDAANRQEVPYQDTFWDEMETLLPKQKTGGFTSIFLVLPILISIVFGGYVLLSTGNSNSIENNSLALVDADLNNNTQNKSASTNTVETKVLNSNESAALNQAEYSQRNNTNASNWKQKTNMFKSIAPQDDFLNDDFNGQFITEEVESDFNYLNSLTLKEVQEFEFEKSIIPLLFSLKSRTKHFYLAASAGTVNSPLVQHQSANRWGSTFAIQTGYETNKDAWNVGVGLRISSFNFNQLELSRASKVYHFSSTSYRQDLQYKMLTFVEAPVSVSYKKNKHTVGLDVSPSYRVYSLMKVNSFEDENQVQSGFYHNQNIGLTNFNIHANLRYELNLTKDMRAGVQVGSMLLNPIKNDAFNAGQKSMPVSVQFTFKQFLF
jgi:hypothetical protein